MGPKISKPGVDCLINGHRALILYGTINDVIVWFENMSIWYQISLEMVLQLGNKGTGW